ncbi:ABC transporter permease [Paralcaligenes ureilyticus]|uniref:Peptide/nickel transport system permease protein n=1 Tax=Paralcaligenes ureilyticus TaxID=627131 RepID=A0A4R3MBC5_9BURK|nr:ABC transporter permease [Paralcaligenes ureilyticus]TCT09559.1 peptide/nickel transport system permease protein [Paralcaligenes ureilyticus]
MKSTESTIRAASGPADTTSKKPPVSLVLWASVIVLLGCVLVAIFAPYLQPYDPTKFVSYTPFQLSSSQAWLGTDVLGRDVLSRLIGGTRLTLMMALGATVLAHLIGDSLGLYSAVKGGWIDLVLCRVVDVVLSLPKIIVGLVVVAALGSSIHVIVIITGLVYSASVFRIARSLGLDLIQQDFVRVAQARGERTAWLVFGEIVPHVIYPMAADFAIRVSFAILFMSSLSFLGLGVQPPLADWGGMVRENIEGIAAGSYASIYAALAIAVVSVALNLLVDASGEESAFAEMQK